MEPAMSQLREGDFVSPLQLQDIHGKPVAIPSRASRYVHLQFRRYAGCPVCNLHLRTMSRSAKMFADAGIQSVVIVASEDKPVLQQMGNLPFQIVADPGKHLYEQYGVSTSPMSVLAPAAMAGAVKGMLSGSGSPAGSNLDNLFILPAEFLIGPSGKIVACKYSKHAADHWNPYDLLALANQAEEGRKSA